MQQRKILATALVASTIAGVGVMPANTANAASVSTFVSNALAIANDNSHGYSMINRWGPDFDCSSFVITCLKQAGFETGNATYTGNMVSNLTKHGFSYIPASKIDLGSASSLRAGDILMASGHTEIYIGNGKRVGAHRNYDGQKGDSGGNEISVESYSRGSWYGILRYTGSSSSSAAIVQTASTKTSTSTKNTGTYRVDANLNLRKGNSTGTSILTTIPKGKSVKVLATSNGWGKVTYKGNTGWIYLTYATKTSGSSKSSGTQKLTPVNADNGTEKKKETASGTPYKTTGYVNMRTGNGKQYSVIDVINKGTSVRISEVRDGWGKVTHGGSTGWISLKYAKKTGSAASVESKTSAGKAATAVSKKSDSQDAKTTSVVYRLTANVNMRKGGSTSAARIRVLPKGTYINVTKVKDNWGKFTYGGTTGWVSLDYAKKAGSNTVTTVTNVAQNVKSSTQKTVVYTYKTTAYLNMRKSYSIASQRIRVLPKGTKVTVTEIKNNWGKISYDGKTGWVYLKYAAKTGSKTVVTKTVNETPTLLKAESSTVKEATTAKASSAKSAAAKSSSKAPKAKSAVATTKAATAKAAAAAKATTVKAATEAKTAATAATTTARTSVSGTTAGKTTGSVQPDEIKATVSSVPVNDTAAAEAADEKEKVTAPAAEEPVTAPATEESVAVSVVPAAETEDAADAEDTVAVETEAEPAAEETDVEEADVEEADAEEADVEEADVEEADAEETTDVEETDAGEADAQEADVEETDAEEADVEETDAEEVAAETGNYRAQQEIALYADAYDGAERIATFDAGTVLEVIEVQDGWGKVRIEGTSAWIRLDAFEKTDASVTPGLTLSETENSADETEAAQEAESQDEASGDEASDQEDSGYDESGYDDSEQEDSGYDESGYDESEQEDSGYDESGYDESDQGDSDYDESYDSGYDEDAMSEDYDQ